VFEKLPTSTVSHAVNVRSSSHLQLEVQRPEYFGGLRISFLEPCGARISMLQDIDNLFTRPLDCVTPFTQGRQLQSNALLLVCRALRIRLSRREHYTREYGSSNQSLSQHWYLFRQPVTHILSSPVDCNFLESTRSIAGGLLIEILTWKVPKKR
jgi:hypothetical protein